MTDPRRQLFAACKALGIDQDERRALQLEVVGKASTTEFSAADWRKIIAHLNKMTGARSAAPWAGKPGTWRAGCDAMGGKIASLLAEQKLPWRYLTHGANGKPSMAKRLAGVDRLEFADAKGLAALITALVRRGEKANQKAGQ